MGESPAPVVGLRRSDPLAERGIGEVAGVPQRQGIEDLLLDEIVERLAGPALQDFPEQQHAEVRVDGSFTRPGLQFGGGDVLQVAGAGLVAVEVLAEFPEQLGAARQAARMGEEIPQCRVSDRPSLEFRQVGRRGGVQVECSRLDPPHHQGRRRDDLGQRGQVVDRGRGDGGSVVIVGQAAGGPFEDDRAAARDQQNAAGRDTLHHGLLQQGGGLLESLRVEAGRGGRCVVKHGRRLWRVCRRWLRQGRRWSGRLTGGNGREKQDDRQERSRPCVGESPHGVHGGRRRQRGQNRSLRGRTQRIGAQCEACLTAGAFLRPPSAAAGEGAGAPSGGRLRVAWLLS